MKEFFWLMSQFFLFLSASKEDQRTANAKALECISWLETELTRKQQHETPNQSNFLDVRLADWGAAANILILCHFQAKWYAVELFAQEKNVIKFRFWFHPKPEQV